LIINSFFDKWGVCLNSLALRKKIRISRTFLSLTLVLMNLEPMLLITSLGTVFNWVLKAPGTRVERYKLLVKFFAVLVLRITTAILLIFPQVLQWALIIITLTHVNWFVVWGLRYYTFLLFLNAIQLFLFLLFHSCLLFFHFLFMLIIANTAGFHHAWWVHETTLLWIKTHSIITDCSVLTLWGLFLKFSICWLHLLLNVYSLPC